MSTERPTTKADTKRRLDNRLNCLSIRLKEAKAIRGQAKHRPTATAVNAASIPIKEKPDAAGAGASEIMKELFGNYKGDSKESVAGEIDRW